MEKYKHTSVSFNPRLAMALGAGLGAFIAVVFVRDQKHFGVLAFLLCASFIVICPLYLVWMTSLTVKIDGGRLKWCFGYGGPSWSVAVADIQRVDFIRLHDLRCGMGIRGLPWARFGGVNYCIGLREGVQLELRNGRQFAIETDEPKTLAFSLHEAMKATIEN